MDGFTFPQKKTMTTSAGAVAATTDGTGNKSLLGSLTDLELQQKALELGLPSIGTRTTLISRLEQHTAQVEPLKTTDKTTKAAVNGKKKPRRRKKKAAQPSAPKSAASLAPAKDQETETVEIEYIPESLEFHETPEFQAFADVFARFQSQAELQSLAATDADPDTPRTTVDQLGLVPLEEDGSESDSSDGDLMLDELMRGGQEEGLKMSKKKLKKLTRLSVAELKRLVKKPEVVEVNK
jgi:hypothetical protein